MTIRLVDFHADWCDPCESQHAILEKVAENWKNNDTIEIKKVNIEDQHKLRDDYDVNTIPTVMILVDDKEKTEVYERFIGITSEQKINEAISNCMNYS